MHALPSLLRAVGLALALALPGPGSPPDRPLPPQTFLAPGTGPFALQSFAACLEYLERLAGPNIPEWVLHSSLIRYSARSPRYDPQGRPLLDKAGRQICEQVAQTGRVFFPPTWRVPFQRDLPLVVYAHATTMKKHAVASEFGGHEWLLGAAAALYYGFAVAMPDQPGMGGDAGHYHPFCHAKSLAYATLDGIPAAADLFAQDPYLVSGGYSWNGKLYLVGYSEGAYTALASVKELEGHAAEYAAKGIALTGSACMAGPFDLSGLTRADIINPLREYAHSFYLPYIVRAYHEIYGQVLDPREAFAPVLLETREDGDLIQWTDGTLDGLEVGDRIGRRLGVAGNLVIFRSILNPLWLARELDDPAYETSAVHRILVENDLHRGWTPTRPILFSQSPVDQDLPFQNTLATIGYLGAEIYKNGGDPAKLLVSIPIGDCRDGITHIEGALVAMPTAFNWIYYGMPTE